MRDAALDASVPRVREAIARMTHTMQLGRDIARKDPALADISDQELQYIGYAHEQLGAYLADPAEFRTAVDFHQRFTRYRRDGFAAAVNDKPLAMRNYADALLFLGGAEILAGGNSAALDDLDRAKRCSTSWPPRIPKAGNSIWTGLC